VLLILREVSQGVRRFKDMQDHLGVSRSVLSDRLDHLVASGVLELRDYQEPGQRRRSEYHMTQKGRDLYPAITALREWGDKYLADPAGPSMELTHRGCGAHVHTALICDAGHTVAPEELRRQEGPGARRRVAA
jgi:DNA-binding HxlR family transcriptional regulator